MTVSMRQRKTCNFWSISLSKVSACSKKSGPKFYEDKAAILLETWTSQDVGSSPAFGTHIPSDGQCASSSIRNSSSQASVLSCGWNTWVFWEPLAVTVNSLNLPSSISTTAKRWKQPKCPWTDEWIKKMWHTYTMEYYSAIKRNKIELSVMRWMDL